MAVDVEDVFVTVADVIDKGTASSSDSKEVKDSHACADNVDRKYLEATLLAMFVLVVAVAEEEEEEKGSTMLSLGLDEIGPASTTTTSRTNSISPKEKMAMRKSRIRINFGAEDNEKKRWFEYLSF